MKLIKILTWSGTALGLMAGCAVNQGLTLERVGPAPAPAIDRVANQGTLLVYSAYRVTADFNRRDAYRPEYSDYRIEPAAGGAWQRVANTSDTLLQRPKPLQLPPGDYRVMARASSCGWVTVPVTLQAGRTTIVLLQGGIAWPGQPALAPDDAVRLPDGEIVGWKSDMAMK